MTSTTSVQALLLTDVVGSTDLSEKIGDSATAAVWTAHDRMARDLLRQHGGREIDKTDGMLLMFSAARSAVDYALAYHDAMRRLPIALQARVGLHVGPVILRENSAADVANGAKPLEVDGLAKPMAARVMSMASGGQTLITADAAKAIDADDAGPAWRTRSHGHWAVKGVSEPVEVLEVAGPDSQFSMPRENEKAHRVARIGERWMLVSEIANNLPVQRTSFVGREVELDDIKTILDESHLLTLVGMGGLGKTRLAVQAARESLWRYTDGAWFVDLSPVTDPMLVVSEAARALDIFDEPGRPLIDTLCQHLRNRQLLFVIDNCEHLLEAAGDLVEAILRKAPKVRIVASSREPLDLPGEQVYPVLPLPPPVRGGDAQELWRSPAVRLFTERARAQRPDFQPAEVAPDVLADLVQRLEGIPLAIELAAARLRSMSVEEILEGLRDRFGLLTGGSRVLQRRQQTLRALVDWSYHLLDETDRRLLARLAVFRGGFDVASAGAVCAEPSLREGAVTLGIGSLVEKSLVLPPGRGERHRMLETIRDYAAEKLAEAGEAVTLGERHCLYFFERSKEAKNGLLGPDQAQHIERMEADLDNMRAAHEFALQGHVDPFVSVKIPVAMQSFWRLRGYFAEGRAAVRAALELPAVKASPMAHAHALYVGAALATGQGDHAQAREQLQTCLDLRRQLDKPVEVAATLSTLAEAQLQGGEIDGAIASETEALAIFVHLQDRQGQAVGHLHLANCLATRGNAAEATEHLRQARAIARAIDHAELQADCAIRLGLLSDEGGDTDAARQWHQEAVAISEGSGNRRCLAEARWGLGRVALREQRLDEARRLFGEALAVYRDFDMREEAVRCLEDVARLALLGGQPEPAMRLATGIAACRHVLALPRPAREEAGWGREVAALRGQLDEDAMARAHAEGRAMTLAEAIRFGQGLLGRSDAP